MSRSVHTRPLRVRAPARAAEPFAGRGHRDERRARAARRAMRALGQVPALEHAPPEPLAAEPRVVVHAPRPGHTHAASAAQVAEVLAALGPAFHHGLASVELRRGPDAAHRLVTGRYAAPGRVALFDLPRSPWRLPGLDDAGRGRLLRAGAWLALDERGVTVATWPETALRDFVLLDVLLHELGHHVVQRRRGKQRVARARAADHERAAEVVAERARRLLGRPR